MDVNIISANSEGYKVRNNKDIIIGIDAGTSVVKAVAFSLSGVQIASHSVQSQYKVEENGAATQSLSQTWMDCAETLRGLGSKLQNLAMRTAAISVTGQGEGTWLVGKNNQPTCDAWLWLDARAASTVEKLRKKPTELKRYQTTGTGLAACQQGPQIAYMSETQPDLLSRSEIAFRCKDWLYLSLTNIRATDPSEASFSYGDFRTRQYDDFVIDALGVNEWRHLLPPIIDGTITTHPLTKQAAIDTGLLEGTPVSLGFVDIVCTALGAGVYTQGSKATCTIIGSTGMHLRASKSEQVELNKQNSGYVIALPVPNIVTQVQSNMAAALNIDWALQMAGDLMADFGQDISHKQLVQHIEIWLSKSQEAKFLYHPYISKAGERGPFVNANARAGFIGLTSEHRFPDILRAVIEGLGMATRDCYAAMGEMPNELRLTGGAARSSTLRSILGACVGAPTSVSSREEAGAAGAAMMAAVAIGVYDNMDDCIAQWVTPLLGEVQKFDPELAETYDRLYTCYVNARHALEPIWQELQHI